MNIKENNHIMIYLWIFMTQQVNKLSNNLCNKRLADDDRQRRITHYVKNTLKPMQ
jgi:hypothetical protein